MIHILLADDHKMVMDGIQALLKDDEDFQIVDQVLTGHKVIDVLSSGVHVDILILDINMPDLDGIETTRIVRKRFRDVKILILSMYNKPAFIQQLIGEGISGYILKNTGKDELVTAIRKICAGEDHFSQEVTKTMMGALKGQSTLPEVKLTRRELEILRLLAKALTTAEIAEKLFLSTFTVDTHRKNLLSKLNQKNTPGLVKYAMEHGLTEERF